MSEDRTSGTKLSGKIISPVVILKTNTTEGRNTNNLGLTVPKHDSNSMATRLITNTKGRTELQSNQLQGDVNQGLMKLIGFVNGHPATMLIDCGASGNFIDEAFVK